jgi:hypothetical protein
MEAEHDRSDVHPRLKKVQPTDVCFENGADHKNDDEYNRTNKDEPLRRTNSRASVGHGLKYARHC